MLQNFFELLEPIKEQIDKYPNTFEDDIPIIVMTHFPPDEKIQEIADFINQHDLENFSSLTPAEQLDCTRTIVGHALENAALGYLQSKDPEDEYSEDLLFSEDEDLWFDKDEDFDGDD